MSDESFINDLLGPFIRCGKVKGKSGEELYLSKSQVSRIMNQKDDCPESIRHALPLFGLRENVEKEYSVLIDELLDMSAFDAFADEVIKLCSSAAGTDLSLENELKNAHTSPARFLSCVMFDALKRSNLETSERKLWSRGTGALWVAKGDLLQIGFARRGKTKPKPIIVIPVDTCFRSHVTHGYEKVKWPVVSERTLHGKWIMRMEASGVSEEELASRIGEALSLHVEEPFCEGSGYPIGTVAPIETDKAVFYLLTVSIFDEHNHAHSTSDDISRSVRSLMEFYDLKGQGQDLFLPLIGAGLSRSNLDLRESFGMLVERLGSQEIFMGGKVSIVVLPDAARELGLSD